MATHRSSASILCILMGLMVSVAWSDSGVQETVLKALDPSNPLEQRVLAIQQLGASKDESAVRPLSDLCSNPSEPHAVRTNAARALAHIGEPRGEILSILEQVYREPDASVNLQYTVLESLGNLEAAEALSLLQEALSVPDGTMRFKAAQALGKIATPEAFQYLSDRLTKESDRYVRAQIVRALGNTGNAAAEPILIQALTADPEPLVRYNAALLLKGFKKLTPAARAALDAAAKDSSPLVRQAVKEGSR